MGDEYVEAVRNWPIPTATKQVEQFLRFVNYHRNCISHFADVAYPLHKFTGKNARTMFHVNPRNTKFITLAYVPGALHSPKLIRTN
jgi:hypothetical protein